MIMKNSGPELKLSGMALPNQSAVNHASVG